jgi:cytidylate kinase
VIQVEHARYVRASRDQCVAGADGSEAEDRDEVLRLVPDPLGLWSAQKTARHWAELAVNPAIEVHGHDDTTGQSSSLRQARRGRSVAGICLPFTNPAHIGPPVDLDHEAPCDSPDARTMAANDFNGILTIDGASGTGKTTLLHGIGDRFGCTVLELGPIVRSAAWLSSRDRTTTADAIARLDRFRERDVLRVDRVAAGMLSATEVELDGILPRQDSFSSALGDATVAVATHSEAMEWIYALVRATIRGRRAALSARDGASSVCHEAPLHICLEASPSARAARKRHQLQSAGLGGRWLDDAILCRWPERVNVMLDTTFMTTDEVLKHVSGAIERRLGWQPRPRGLPATDRCDSVVVPRVSALQTT